MALDFKSCRKKSDWSLQNRIGNWLSHTHIDILLVYEISVIPKVNGV